MSGPTVRETQTVAIAEHTEAESGTVQTPPLLFWTLAVSVFAVMVFAMQRLMAPRARVTDLQGAEEDPEESS